MLHTCAGSESSVLEAAVDTTCRRPCNLSASPSGWGGREGARAQACVKEEIERQGRGRKGTGDERATVRARERQRGNQQKETERKATWRSQRSMRDESHKSDRVV